MTCVETCASPTAAFQTAGRKSGQVLVRTQKANTPARRGWNADRAQPFLVIAARDANSISDDRQKKRTGFGPHRTHHSDDFGQDQRGQVRSSEATRTSSPLRLTGAAFHVGLNRGKESHPARDLPERRGCATSNQTRPA